MNLDVLMEAAEGNVDFARELAALYLSGIEEQLNLLRMALAERAMERIGHIAHYCKGSSVTCGALALAELFHQLSQLAQQNQFDECSRVAADVVVEFGRVQETLRALPQTQGAPT
ncbi:MAG TPA: Hpt domain-containing protein [Verrucomicrobiae bacterium]|nr:Hpt domain-containing protein [Verrucomicrobiae bacterium]